MNKTALIVIDFINDIVHPDGKISSPANYIKENNTFAKVNKAIAFAREKNILIAHVKVGFKDYLECPENSPLFGAAKKANALQLDTWGTEFHKEIDVQTQDLIITKPRVSAFYNTRLSAFLSAQNISTIILCGVSTNMTVEATARDAHDRDYEVIIVADACATATKELHDNTLTIISRLAKIINVDELT